MTALQLCVPHSLSPAVSGTNPNVPGRIRWLTLSHVPPLEYPTVAAGQGLIRGQIKVGGTADGARQKKR